MIKDFSRRLFLRGGKPLPIRPPWALPENEFVASCTRCGACLSHCPQQILEPDRAGFPRVNFSRGECTFCGECVRQCLPQALIALPGALPWRRKAVIAETCLNVRGIQCRTCGEQCERQAILFRPAPGGHTLPRLVVAECNGCGACFAVCPVQAISITS
ncbi:ferredoxin-type protein NapF [Thiovibrio sp. JS02]